MKPLIKLKFCWFVSESCLVVSAGRIGTLKSYIKGTHLSNIISVWQL